MLTGTNGLLASMPIDRFHVSRLLIEYYPVRLQLQNTATARRHARSQRMIKHRSVYPGAPSLSVTIISLGQYLVQVKGLWMYQFHFAYYQLLNVQLVTPQRHPEGSSQYVLHNICIILARP